MNKHTELSKEGRIRPYKERITTRHYIIQWKEIREKLGLLGSFKRMELCCGRSPNQIDVKVSTDVETYDITTEEIE